MRLREKDLRKICDKTETVFFSEAEKKYEKTKDFFCGREKISTIYANLISLWKSFFWQSSKYLRVWNTEVFFQRVGINTHNISFMIEESSEDVKIPEFSAWWHIRNFEESFKEKLTLVLNKEWLKKVEKGCPCGIYI